MTLGFDATYRYDRRPTGVSVYSAELIDAFASQPAFRARKGCEGALTASENAARALRFAGDSLEVISYVRPHRLMRAWRAGSPNLRLLVDGLSPNCQVFHGLNQRLPKPGRARYAVTFHDLFVMTAEYSTREFRERFTAQARIAAARADLSIAVSEFTASQLEALLQVERARIRVIPHGTHYPEFLPAVERQPQVLFVGALQERKNVRRLIEAFEAAPAGWRLILAGSTGFGAEAITQAMERSPRRKDIVQEGYVSAARLEELYRTSSILAFPSLDEGFGIPILDAMAHGLPVLTSRRSACPEVAGDAALLVDPLDTAGIATGLVRLIDDSALRQELSLRGRLRAKEFSWSRAARMTADVYRELVPGC